MPRMTSKFVSMPFDAIITVAVNSIDNQGRRRPLNANASVTSSDPSVTAVLSADQSKVTLTATAETGTSVITLFDGQFSDSIWVTIENAGFNGIEMRIDNLTFAQNLSPP